MTTLYKPRSKKIGLPAGSLVYVGNQKKKEVSINLIDYDEKNFEKKKIKDIKECLPYKNKKSVTWIDIDGVQDTELLSEIGKEFKIHPLILEDILNTDQRPKMQEFDDYLFIVLKMFIYNEKNNQITSEQVSLIFGDRYVISFQEGIEGDIFDIIRNRIETSKGKTRKMGTDYLVYSIIDQIVDFYFLILEKIGDKVEFLEQEVLNKPIPKTLSMIQVLKREMILLRKAVFPLREEVNSLIRDENDLIKPETRIFLRDIYDHTIQVIDNVETYRDMLSGLLDIYLSSISNRLNEVMKVLTVITTIFMPLTLIAGLYGMNFKYMPELLIWWWYPMVWASIFVIGISMFIYFKVKKWV